MKKINILLGALLLSLTGCSNGPQADTSSIKVMCPKGAPSLAFYNKTNNLTTGGAAEVKPELLKSDYDFVVFDFYNGLKLQKANEGHYSYLQKERRSLDLQKILCQVSPLITFIAN